MVLLNPSAPRTRSVANLDWMATAALRGLVSIWIAAATRGVVLRLMSVENQVEMDKEKEENTFIGKRNFTLLSYKH